MKRRLVLAMVLLSIGPAQDAIRGADREPTAMRPLRVVEARRAIHGPAPVTIEEPGSYYLASNIDAAGLPAVIIKAPNVNLDLNGFTIAGSQDNLGVVLGDNTLDVVLRNGTIRDFAQGLINAGVTSVTLSNLTIAENLRNGVGIDRGGVGVFIDGCTIVRNGEHGILAVGAHVVITNSDVTNNGFDGIALLESASVTVQGNRVSDNGGSGIHAAILFQGDSAPMGTIFHNVLFHNGRFGIETSSAAGPFPDLSIAGNFATGNGLGNYTLTGANAAPVATLASNPGAWANVQ